VGFNHHISVSKARVIPPIADHPPHVVFWCPGCKGNHVVPYVNKRPHPKDRAIWFFDENIESPTIEPSLRVTLDDKTACHVVVTAGILNYEGDSAHELRGQRIPMTDCRLITDEEGTP
jgi:hypothetical protein